MCSLQFAKVTEPTSNTGAATLPPALARLVEGAGDPAKPYFSDGGVKELAQSSGIQINVLTRTPLEASQALSEFAAASNGRFISYVGEDSQDAQEAADNALRSHLAECDDCVHTTRRSCERFVT